MSTPRSALVRVGRAISQAMVGAGSVRSGRTLWTITATSQASLAFLQERPMPDRLAELGLPVLVIFGSRDRRWQPSSVEDYRRVPQARVEILNGVGHTPMLEDPDTTAALLRGFAVDTASR